MFSFICLYQCTYIPSRLKKVQSKKKERAAVDEVLRLEGIKAAEEKGMEGNIYIKNVEQGE